MINTMSRRVLLIDNYDSFVHNLARYLTELGCATDVVRNDRLTVDQIAQEPCEAVVISPGPCSPAEAGVSVSLVRELSGTVPILGVCLGHQSIAAALGGRVIRAPEPVHGRASRVLHDGTRLFEGLPSPLTVGRYHSLVAEAATLPPVLGVTARTDDGLVMAIEHESHPTWGVQFHPESILTEGGHALIANFLRLAGEWRAGGTS